MAVAVDQHMFSGVNVKFQQVGDAQETSLFIGGDAQLGSMSPWGVAEFDAQGENIEVLSTTGATNFINGVLIQAKNANKYKTIADLKGQKLAIPGLGSDTYAAFASYVKAKYNLDAKTAFHLVTASAGAELGLLSTGQVAAALTFSGQTATGMANSKLKLIFSFTKAWQQDTGQPLVVDALVAKGDWADAHPDLVKDVLQGLQKAVDWMRAHPKEFNANGKYAKLAAGEGWIVNSKDTAATPQILKLLQQGKWYLSSDAYTQQWINAMYKFIKDGQGVMYKGNTPAIDKIFYNPPQ